MLILILHSLVSILHQIQEGLLAQTFIERNQRQPAGVVAFDAHCLTSNGFPRKTSSHNLQNAIEKRDQIRRMWFGMKRTSEIQKLGDQVAEPVNLGRNVSGQLASQRVRGLQFLG